MKKNFIMLFIMVAFFLSVSAVLSPNASAQDVWAYTRKDGVIFYVKTETARYRDNVWLDVDVVRIDSPSHRYTTNYEFVYRRKEGKWKPWFGLGAYDFDDEYIQKNKPEAYSIFVIARQYAR